MRSTESKSESPFQVWKKNIKKLKFERVQNTELNARQILDMVIPSDEEICAVTTIQNFSCDDIEQFVSESDWVIVTKEKFLEPKFQQHLASKESLKNLCKKSREGGLNKKRVEVVAKPPACHCKELKSKEVKKPSKNPLRRFFEAIRNICRRLCRRIRDCLKFRSAQEKDEIKEHISDVIHSYECR